MPQPVRTKYVDESDKLYLEDELQRIILMGDLDVQTSVTGIITMIYNKWSFMQLLAKQILHFVL